MCSQQLDIHRSHACTRFLFFSFFSGLSKFRASQLQFSVALPHIPNSSILSLPWRLEQHWIFKWGVLMRLERGSGFKVLLVLTEDLNFLLSPQVWLLTAACSSSTRDLMLSSVLREYLYGWDVNLHKHKHTNSVGTCQCAWTQTHKSQAAVSSCRPQTFG